MGIFFNNQVLNDMPSGVFKNGRINLKNEKISFLNQWKNGKDENLWKLFFVFFFEISRNFRSCDFF